MKSDLGLLFYYYYSIIKYVLLFTGSKSDKRNAASVQTGMRQKHKDRNNTLRLKVVLVILTFWMKPVSLIEALSLH